MVRNLRGLQRLTETDCGGKKTLDTPKYISFNSIFYQLFQVPSYWKQVTGLIRFLTPAHFMPCALAMLSLPPKSPVLPSLLAFAHTVAATFASSCSSFFLFAQLHGDVIYTRWISHFYSKSVTSFLTSFDTRKCQVSCWLCNPSHLFIFLPKHPSPASISFHALVSWLQSVLDVESHDVYVLTSGFLAKHFF